MTASSWVHISVEEIIRETDSTFLFQIGDDQVWIPRSQVANPDDYEEGDKDLTVSITEWIAKQNGLEGLLWAQDWLGK